MRLIFTTLAIALALAGQALAERRIALVIGNGSYSDVAPLSNPVADANLMSETLDDLGFEVTKVTDASLAELRQEIGRFGRTLRAAEPGSTALFYYAGHGVQSFGQNYLLPVDAELSDAADLDIVSVDASSVLRQMASAPHVSNIVILDACRDNPFTAIPDFNDNGLAEMKAPTGTYLAYATAPGDVAYDGDSTNSPFTSALAREMGTPGAPIEQVFKKVRISVLEETGGRQTPWDTSSLMQEFSFKPAVVLSSEEQAARNMWTEVQATQDPLQILLFLRAFPDSSYDSEARSLLTTLVEKDTQPADRGLVPMQSKTQIPTEPAPAPVLPEASEQELIGIAQASGEVADFEAYLAAYPEGVFAELARFEIDVRKEIAAAPAAPAAAPPAPAEQEVAALAPTGPIVFESPVTTGAPEILGLSIAQLIQGSPIFPPIEGLPPEIWQDQSCSNCHQWTADDLCTQAQVYVSTSAARSLTKKHPYGGGFKAHLKAWAEGGCR